jgi:predicted N-acetyltransferase YhbS
MGSPTGTYATLTTPPVIPSEAFVGRFLAPIWVLPEYQNRGVGSLLLKECFAIADAQHPPTPVYLESAPPARGFYSKLGFEPVIPVGGDIAKHPQFVRRGPKKEQTQKYADKLANAGHANGVSGSEVNAGGGTA